MVQLILERKLKLFGHICRMDDNRLVKNVVFGIVEGQNRRGRLSRELMNDINERCLTDGPFRGETSCHGGRRTNSQSGDELSMKHWTPTD